MALSIRIRRTELIFAKDFSMNIEGSYTLQAPPHIVWQCLKDKELLRQAFPGLVRFEPAGNDAYEIALQVKSLPLSGTYYGLAHVTENLQPDYYHVMITDTGNEGQNMLSGNGGIHVSEHDGNTIITYKGSISLSKRGMRVSPVVAKGAAKLLLQQFFTVLAEQLRLQTTIQEVDTEELAGATVIRQAGGDIVVLPRVTADEPQEERRSLSQVIARFLGLGGGNPDEEERWAQRIRRFGIISGLLVLVWIGMRLPRRRK
jgi:carbon monoxide dehydrogenase subunit G